ncbi:MAG: ABC transporter permease [Bacteroidota bacterium]
MILSYFKTARRVITRNRIFSLINIIGLAASMSVALLFISILTEMLKYDNFHEKKDRIVRVITTSRDAQYDVDLATSSLALAQEIRENVTEAETITTLGYGFNGDFKNGDKIQTLKGSWAQSSLFEVFTFPLVSGNSSTALTEPNTMVITESASKRIFGTTDVLGKSLVRVGTEPGKNPEFVITGVMKDVSKFSHMQFEVLGSSATNESNNPATNSWTDVWSNHNYVVLREGVSVRQFQAALDHIAARRNAELGSDNKQIISLDTQRLTNIVFFSKSLDNQIGATMPTRFFWLISGCRSSY